jgi:hypothetical protein
VNAGRLALAAAASLTLAACGYSSRRLVGERGVESVAIVQFDNRTYRRDLEFRVTRAVAEEIRARTTWRIESASSADALLRGTIRSADTGVLVEAPDRTPIASRLRVVADVELVERVTGRVLRRFTAFERQEYTEGRFGESLEGSAIDVVAMSLAQDVVQGLERPIGEPQGVPPPNAPQREFPRR